MPASSSTRHVRQPVVAGSFYPRSRAELTALVDRLLDVARDAGHGATGDDGDALGVVVPHAGYVYSGPVAAAGYVRLAVRPARPTGVVILGPSHFVPLVGLALPTDDAWATPLGEASIDEDCRELAIEAGATVDDRVHDGEHSMEVQLPFIQRSWPGAPVLPIAVGTRRDGWWGELIDRFVARGAAIVVSTDLSHHHGRSEARRLDERTAAAIEALDVESLGPADACGYDPLCACLAWARSTGLRVRRLELSDSSAGGGGTARVVGYGAFVLERAR
jgi:AmmeMemoRadiSam system protein B